MRRLVLLLIWTLPLALYAQEKNFRFEHITTRNGLSQNHVNYICQDTNGFLWIGTYNGLNRYDGYEFKTYHHKSDDSTSLSLSSVNVIFVDRSGFMWVGTDQGLNKYNPLEDNFIRYFHLNTDATIHPDNNIRTIYEDSEGVFWIGFYGGGLKNFYPDTGTFKDVTAFSEDKDSILYTNINAFHADNMGIYWVGSERAGLTEYNPETKELNRHSIEKDEKAVLNDTLVSSITSDRQGNIWIGTWRGGLHRYHKDTQKFQNIPIGLNSIDGLHSSPITSLFFDADSFLWIGTLGDGVVRYDISTNKAVNIRSDPNDIFSLNNDVVWSVFQDLSGVIWLGTYGGGVNRFYPGIGNFESFRFESGHSNWLNHSNITSCVEVNADTLLFGTLGGGINIFCRSKRAFTYLLQDAELPARIIRYLFKDREGRIWVSTDHGVYRYSSNLDSSILYPYANNPGGLGDKSVYSIYQDQEGNMWFGIWGEGVIKLSYKESLKNVPEEAVFNSYPHAEFARNSVWAFHQDSKGVLWLGTGAGLFKYSKADDTFIKHTSSDSNLNISISSFYEDEVNNKLIVGTLGRGVAFFSLEDHSLTFVSEQEGMLHNDVFSVHADKSESLWFGTNNGMSRYDTRSQQFRHFDVEMGLYNNELINKSWLLSTGEIVVGTNNGIHIFNPNHLYDSSFEPNVVISEFWVMDQHRTLVPCGDQRDPCDQDYSIDLAQNENSFTFVFAALDFRLSQSINYRYMLEGFDPDWITVSSGHRRVNYSNLDGGEYIFRINASNSDGSWTGREKSIKISVASPFYQTLPFRIALSILFILLVLTTFRFIERTIKHKIRKKKEILSRQILLNEKKKLEKQKDVLKFDLDQKVREVTAANAFIQSRKGRLTKLKTQFLSFSKQMEPNARKELMQLIQEIDQELKGEKGMKEFIENLDTLQDGFIC